MNLTIIAIEANESGQHRIESQSGRKSCWLPGYIEVPAHLEGAVWDSLGWCELDIQDGKLVGVTPTERPEPQPSAGEEIATLKAKLSATDYRVIKCAECQLVGEPAPYDLAELHRERQTLRDRINQLETAQSGK